MEDFNIEYKLQFSKRKSIGIIIKENGDVYVRAPEGMKKEDIDRLVNKKKDWINKKVANFKNREALNEDEVLFLGRVYNKEVIVQKYLKREFVCIDENKFLINVKSMDRADNALEKFLRIKCKEKINDIVKEYSLLTGLVPKEIKIKEQKTKWGCCTYDNRIFFNWRLIMARESAIKYVVVHEMCHMLEKNHSKKFWHEVKKVMPSYEEEDRYLKEKGYLMKI